MAVRLYDEALFQKIQKWVKDPHLQILKPEETSRMFEIEADTKNDTPLTLPIIALSRDKSVDILSTTKQPRTFAGWTLSRSNTSRYSLNVIPIRIGYQIDIYTKGMEEADEYVRNFVFNLVNYPQITVNIPYSGANIEHNSTLSLESSIVDNSDIREHLFADEFVRFTLKVFIDDAYLFSVPESNLVTLEGLGLEVEDRVSKQIVERSQIM